MALQAREQQGETEVDTAKQAGADPLGATTDPLPSKPDVLCLDIEARAVFKTMVFYAVLCHAGLCYMLWCEMLYMPYCAMLWNMLGLCCNYGISC